MSYKIEGDGQFTPVWQAAKTLGLSGPWLRAQAAAGLIPSVMIGDRLMFDLAEVRAALANAMPTTTDPAPTPAPPVLLKESEMARRLRVRPAWLRSQVAAGVVPVAGGTTELPLFAVAAVERALCERAERELGITTLTAVRSHARAGVRDMMYFAGAKLTNLLEFRDRGAGAAALQLLDTLASSGIRVTMDPPLPPRAAKTGPREPGGQIGDEA